jgi:hypothetical protein
LVCAIGTRHYTHRHHPLLLALLALVGGGFAWLVHMTGALLGPLAFRMRMDERSHRPIS